MTLNNFMMGIFAGVVLVMFSDSILRTINVSRAA